MSRKLLIVRLMPSFLLPLTALADKLPATAPIKNIPQLEEKGFCAVANLLFDLAIVIGVIFILIAAFKYLSASGDEEKFREAHRALIYGAVGIAVALLAAGAPFIIANFFNSEENPFGETICP